MPAFSWWLLTMAGPAAAADVLIDAVRTELQRAQDDLRLPDAEGPYHINAVIYDGYKLEVRATLGGITLQRESPWRLLGATVRVGSPERDSTNFEAWQNGSGARGLVHQDHTVALRHDAWLLFDGLYKQAVEVFGAKEAAMQRRAEPDTVPDYAPGKPQQAVAKGLPAPDVARLTALTAAISAVFRGHPEIEFSTVMLDAEVGRRIVLDSDGTEVVEPHGEVGLRVIARIRAADGATQIDQRLYLVRTDDDLPSEAHLLADAEAMAAGLARWRALPTLSGEYVGPIVLEEQAALDAVRYLLADAFVGTPPREKPPLGSRVIRFDDDSGSRAMQPKRRILPSGWSVDDDPTRDLKRPSGYRFDDEGEPARPVVLASDGVVRQHLMSRIPSEAFAQSTGHGRGVGEEAKAQPADFRVVAPRVTSERKQHKLAIKLAAAYGSDHYIVVRRLRDRAVAFMDGGALLSNRDFESPEGLPAPITVWRVYKDGREEGFRGAALAGIDLRSFKEIVAAGEPVTATVLVGGGANVFTGPNVGSPVTFTAPTLMFAEGVVAPTEVIAERPPRLSNPLLAPSAQGPGHQQPPAGATP